MTLKERDPVVLVRDLPGHGLKAGDLGAVVQIHSSDALEVEFVRASGQTQALVRVTDRDIRPAGDRDLISVRSLSPGDC